MGGLAIGIVGVWVLVQVIGGDALHRLGILSKDDDTFSSNGDGAGGNGGGGSW